MLTNISITGIILISLTILLFFRFARYISDKFIRSISVKQWLKKALFALELIVWFILIYQLAEKSISKYPVLSIIMILLLVFIVSWTFWYVLRDYLAGIYIRISGRFRLNETIAFDDSVSGGQDIKGKITSFTDRHLVLEIQDNATIELPYSKLFNKKMERHVQSVDEELTLLFEIKSSEDKERFMHEIKKQVLELPWISHKHEPKLIIQKQENAKTYLELKVILLDKKYRNRVEEILTKK